MADVKITALGILTAADPINDAIPIVDVSDPSMAASGTTKRISINNILSSSPTASGALTVTGLVTAGSATITGDLTVDTSTLKVDSTNDRVGIGTASPAQFVHLSKSNTSTALTSPPVGGASFRIQNTSSTNNNFGSVEFYNAAGLFGASVNCQYTNQATPTSDLVFVTRGSLGGLEHYRIAADGVCTWSEVGGVAGTAMTLNSTGLGIGRGPTAALDVYRAEVSSAAGTTASIINTTGGGNRIAALRLGNLSNQWNIRAYGSGDTFRIGAGSIGSEVDYLTLDASGNLLIKKTAISSSTLGCELTATGQINGATANLDNLNIFNTTAVAYRFYVSAAGTIFATNTVISAISDARYKENVQDIDVGLAAILSLKPRKFDWKAGKGKDIKGDRGFIAQEFETVFPNLIDEWKDPAPEGEAPYKSVRQDLIPVLVKAIQELTARVQTLEAR
tara:strand:+ start:176 stop:1522 length:1347 start_codon:yes stop_codon:yes gene_type:complete